MSLLRPTASIKSREDTTIASLILYKDREEDATDNSKGGIDYLSALDTIVSVPVSSLISTGRSGDIPLLSLDDQSTAYLGVFNNFVLASVSEANSSISKLHMNFSNSYNTFFFSEAPKQISFSGGFFDTADFPYYQEFMVAYDRYLSGSKLAESGMKMNISYDGKVIEGYINSISVNTDASSQAYKTFQFSMIALSTTWDRMNYIRDDKTGEIVGYDDFSTGSGLEDNSVNVSGYNYAGNVGRLNGSGYNV